MSFKLFMYYCALSGGWACFLVWAIIVSAETFAKMQFGAFGSTVLTALLLGMLVAGAVGLVDAIGNSTSTGKRGMRVIVCLMLGAVGGLFAVLIGATILAVVRLVTSGTAQWVIEKPVYVIGWILTGVFIGASLGAYDVI